MRIVEPVNIEDRQTKPLKVWHKTPRSKKRHVLIGSLLLLFLISSTSVVVGYLTYQTYHNDFLLAQTGMQHLRSAMTLLASLQEQPFALQTVERAHQEFTDALSDTQTLQAELTKFSGIANLTPVYGPRLKAAIHLSALAVDASQAGIGGCEMLEIVFTRLGSPFNTSTSGLTNADFTVLFNKYQAVKVLLNAAMREAMLLQPGDISFDAHLVKLLQEFQANIPMLRTTLAQVDQLLPVLPNLLGIGTSAHYLIEILDSTELRPGGGFIGNYGIATFSGGRLTAARITDTYLLDKPFEFAGHTIPFPPTYSWFAHYLALSSWSLRDSNLDADFPTAARYAEANFEHEGGNVPLQGVVAITPSFIEQVLKITGPISVPEYHEMITAQNLVDRIHYHQLVATGESTNSPSSLGNYPSQRKRFTELLGEHLQAHIQQLPSSTLPTLVKVFIYAIQSKDVQVYLNAGAAENLLLLNHLADAIESPGGDSLFVVDANVGGGKANNLITSTVSDQVTIDSSGNAIHHVTLRYAWTTSGNVYGSGLYKDYVRVYVPVDSVLLSQQGWQPQGSSVQFGRKAWAGFFTLVNGQTRTISLIWSSQDAAKRNASSWHYQYLLQRQAGIQRTLALQVMPPSCATVTSKWNELVSKGKQEETFNKPLTQDVNVQVDYICK